MRREAQIEAREQAVKLRADIEPSCTSGAREMLKIEERVLAQGGGDRAASSSSSSAGTRASPTARCTRAAPGRAEAGERDAQLTELERIAGMTLSEAKAHLLERGEELVRHELARRVRQARGGSARRVEAARPQPRRRRAPARRREPCRRDDGLGDRAAVRRHEGPDHRPRGPQHPRARAPDRRRLHHRRHAARGRALVVRRPSPRDRAADADEADRGRAHPSGPDRGDVLPVEGGDRGARPPGRRAGRVRGELRRLPRGAREDPRPAAVPHELRAERAQAHARGRPPRRDHGGRARGERQDGEARRDAARPRQGDDARGRGLARAHLGAVRAPLRRVAGTSSTRSRRTTTRCSRRPSRPCC